MPKFNTDCAGSARPVVRRTNYESSLRYCIQFSLIIEGRLLFNVVETKNMQYTRCKCRHTISSFPSSCGEKFFNEELHRTRIKSIWFVSHIVREPVNIFKTSFRTQQPRFFSVALMMFLNKLLIRLFSYC